MYSMWIQWSILYANLAVQTSGTVEGGCRHVRPLRSASLVVADSSNMADVLPVGTWRPCHGQGLPLGEITQDLHEPVILPSDDHTRQTRPTRSRARICAAGRRSAEGRCQRRVSSVRG